MANDEIDVKIFLPVVLIPFVFRPLRLEGEEEKISFLNPTKKKGLHLLDVTPRNYGGAEGDRTPGLLNAIQARSQLRHSPTRFD